MKTPGPDHPITINPSRQHFRARFESHVIADSTTTVVLQEAGYPAVCYFPRDDVEMGFMSQSPTTTVCPYKGQATYWSMLMNGDLAENVAWTYEDPYPAMAEIRGRLAFDAKKVEVYVVDEHELENRRRDPAVGDWPAQS